MKPMTAAPLALAPTTSLTAGRGFEVTALLALFGLTLRQHFRGRRLLVLSVLFLLPSVMSLLLQLPRRPPRPDQLEFAFVFNLIPHALATLTALLYAAGMVQDEVEEQTLTYLLLRPLPRWALYVTKYAATLVVTATLTFTFTTLTLVVIYWNTPELSDGGVLERVLKTAALLALAQVGYCAMFGALGLYTRRSLIAGLVYIFVFEGLLANFQAMTRQLTVMYYFRVLTVRWLEPLETVGKREWAIDLTTAPSAGSCVLTVLGASAVFVILGALRMQRQEFRMKTPEGS
jgi:ABC-2 type transport system permease protein